VKKTFFFVFFIIILVWIVHGSLLIRISKLEQSINKDKKELEIVEKELNRKIIEYDTKIDLDKIGKEMRTKKNMEISNKINFFQIEN
jgi:NhaP-type Na+/H+ and K+/H+ antiporter